MTDIRERAARYYDASPFVPKDVDFYRGQLPGPHAAVLELGCGTGRVLIPLAPYCGFIHGLDLSPAMLEVCREKMSAAGMKAGDAVVAQADITDFDLGRAFDLVTAPFRVMQNLETDAQVEGLLDGIRRHLAPGGSAILNAFHPNRDPERMRAEWVREGDILNWDKPYGAGRLVHFERYPRMDPDRLILYPELVYRYYENDELVDETVLKIAMRCWYPDELKTLVTSHGFEIVDSWGGYEGEAYGEGRELVVAFKL